LFNLFDFIKLLGIVVVSMDTTIQNTEATMPSQGINTKVESQVPASSSKSRGEALIPGVKSSKRRHIPPELWVIIRAAAEGRQVQLKHLSELSGIPYDTLTDRAKRDRWETPLRLQRQQNAMIADTVGGLLEDVVGYVDENSRPEALATKSHGSGAKLYQEEVESNNETVTKHIPQILSTGETISVPAHSTIEVEPDTEILPIVHNVEEVEIMAPEFSGIINTKNANPPENGDEPGSELRGHLEMPAKFRPKETDMLRPNPDTNGREDKIKQLEELSKNLESELKKRARTHQMSVSEITQYSMAYMAEAVKRDPGLGILLSDKLEKMDKMARRNFKLDREDPLSGAKTVILMSDPEFLPPIPEPAILEDKKEDIVDAEIIPLDEQ
jgi:hypothetical protein